MCVCINIYVYMFLMAHQGCVYFDQKYRKYSTIVKYYYNLNNDFLF